MTETNAAVVSSIVAVLVAVGSLIGQYLVYRRKLDAEKNKPKVDDSQAELNDASAAKTMGEAWDLLYAKLEKRVNEQDETIRRQAETIRSLMNSMDKDRAEKEALTRENDELRRRISEQEKEITSLREKVDKLERERQ